MVEKPFTLFRTTSKTHIRLFVSVRIINEGEKIRGKTYSFFTITLICNKGIASEATLLSIDIIKRVANASIMIKTFLPHFRCFCYYS